MFLIVISGDEREMFPVRHTTKMSEHEIKRKSLTKAKEVRMPQSQIETMFSFFRSQRH